MQLHPCCPSCSSNELKHPIEIKDHSVSGEVFTLITCSGCGLLFTLNAPAAHEISRYYQSDAYISHTDGNATLFEKVYQLVRRFTLNSKKQLVERRVLLKKGSLLDIGCGTGAFLFTMKTAGWEVCGMEPDEGARAKASELTQTNILELDQLAAIPSTSMDVISLWHVLEHVHDLPSMLNTIKRVLKHSGKVFIAVPNANAYDAGWYGTHWAAYDVPRHLYHFTPDSISKLLKQYGLTVVDELPMHFDPFYVCMLSEKYRSGSMNIFRSLPLALASFALSLFHKRKASSLIYVVAHES